MLKAVVVDGIAAIGTGPVAAACERNESEREEGGQDHFHAHTHKQDQEPITPPPRFVIALTPDARTCRTSRSSTACWRPALHCPGSCRPGTLRCTRSRPPKSLLPGHRACRCGTCRHIAFRLARSSSPIRSRC